MASRASISTNDFSKAYLAVAWKLRNELTEYERRGFAQFFYLTICGHIESVLSLIIKNRLESIRVLLAWDDLPPMKVEDKEAKIHYCEVTPITTSLLHILSSVSNEAENAPLNKLIELYSKVFSKKLSAIIEKDLNDDLNALASLRNIFAHGRDLFIDFEGSFATRGTLDKNPLQQSAQQLYKAGIIKDFNITGLNYNKFKALFYSDEALLYFYRAIQKIEEKLINSVTFLPEKFMTHILKLPDLEV